MTEDQQRIADGELSKAADLHALAQQYLRARYIEPDRTEIETRLVALMQRRCKTLIVVDGYRFRADPSGELYLTPVRAITPVGLRRFKV